MSTVRTHRIAFARDGVAGLRAKPQTGRPAVQGPAAVAVAERLVRERKEDDPPVTLARIQAAFLAETGQTIDTGHRSGVLREKGLLVAEASAHARGKAGPGGRRGGPSRSGGAASASGGRRHPAAVRRRERGLDPSLPGPHLSAQGL
jgi:hypothetical protein